MPGGDHSSTKPGSAQLEGPTRIRPGTWLDRRFLIAWEQQLGHLREGVRSWCRGLEHPHHVEAIAWPGRRYLRIVRDDRVRDRGDRVVLPADQRHAAGGCLHIG